MIDPRAVVHPEARLHRDVSVGPFTIIDRGVEIGPHCEIGPHVVIRGPARIGARNRIFQFASIGEVPQDLKFAGEETCLELGDDNVVREFATVHRGTRGGGGVTRIGHHNLLMAYAHVAHDCVIGNHTIMANGATLAGHVEIADHAILGGFVGVHQYVRIGAHSFAGMGTMINKDVPPYVLVSGNYARAVGINKEGLRRRGFTEAAIRALHQAFRLIFRSRRPDRLSDPRLAALRRVHPEVETLIRFIGQSRRGAVRA